MASWAGSDTGSGMNGAAPQVTSLPEPVQIAFTTFIWSR